MPSTPHSTAGDGPSLHPISTCEGACTALSLTLSDRSRPSRATDLAGAGFGSPSGIEAGVGLSHSAAALGDPVRLDARLPIVLKFCRSSKLVRLRIAPVPAVLCVSAGPAKGSVFKAIKECFRRVIFHASNLARETDQCPTTDVSRATQNVAPGT